MARKIFFENSIENAKIPKVKEDNTKTQEKIDDSKEEVHEESTKPIYKKYLIEISHPIYELIHEKQVVRVNREEVCIVTTIYDDIYQKSGLELDSFVCFLISIGKIKDAIELLNEIDIDQSKMAESIIDLEAYVRDEMKGMIKSSYGRIDIIKF